MKDRFLYNFFLKSESNSDSSLISLKDFMVSARFLMDISSSEETVSIINWLPSFFQRD